MGKAFNPSCVEIGIGIVGFLSLGGALVYFGYQNAIYPLDKAMGYLARAESAQTPETIADYLRPVKHWKSCMVVSKSEDRFWINPKRSRCDAIAISLYFISRTQ